MLRVFDDLDNFWNDVAAALNLDRVAQAEAQALDEVGVVQRGAADCCAADEDRLEFGYRSELAGAAHLHSNAGDLGFSCLGREFVGDGPARGAAGVAEPQLRGVRIDLEHNSVDFVSERCAPALRIVDELYHVVCGVNAAAMRVHTKAKSGYSIERG